MKFIALLFFILLCGIEFMSNTGQDMIVNEIANAIPYGDKVGHFGIYGLLTLFTNYAFKFRHFGDNVINQYGALLVLLFSTSEEFSQLFFSLRTFSLLDMLANVSGVVVFTLLSMHLGKNSRRYNQRLLNNSPNQAA